MQDVNVPERPRAVGLGQLNGRRGRLLLSHGQGRGTLNIRVNGRNHRAILMNSLQPVLLPQQKLKDDLPEVDDRFCCGICYEVLLQPVSCGKCATLCCKTCLTQSLQQSYRKCPFCRQETGAPSAASDSLTEEMRGIQYPCRHADCGAVLNLATVRHHERMDCPVRQVSCRYKAYGCEWTGSLSCLNDHETTCTLHQVKGLIHQHRLARTQLDRLVLENQELRSQSRPRKITNPFDKLEFALLVLFAGPHLIRNRRQYTELYMTEDSRAAVYHLLTCIPSCLLAVRVFAESIAVLSEFADISVLRMIVRREFEAFRDDPKFESVFPAFMSLVATSTAFFLAAKICCSDFNGAWHKMEETKRQRYYTAFTLAYAYCFQVLPSIVLIPLYVATISVPCIVEAFSRLLAGSNQGLEATCAIHHSMVGGYLLKGAMNGVGVNLLVILLLVDAFPQPEFFPRRYRDVPHGATLYSLLIPFVEESLEMSTSYCIDTIWILFLFGVRAAMPVLGPMMFMYVRAKAHNNSNSEGVLPLVCIGIGWILCLLTAVSI